MKRIAIYLFSSLSLICSAALPASGATVSETLAEIERNSLTLRATAASNEATELELRADNTLPPLSVEYSPFFRSGVSGVASSEMVVSQEFDFPTLYGVRNRQASAERAALDGAAAAERRAFRQDARSRLLTLLLLREEREILDMRIADAEALLALYEKSLENGKSTILEVNKIKLELQELRRELLQNSADLQAQADALQGLNGGQPIDLSDLEHDSPASRLGEASADAAALLAADPAVRAAETEAEAARQGVSVARAGWLPSITLGYRRNTEERESANGLLAGISLPLYGTSSKIRAAKARLTASQLALEAAEAEAEARIAADMRQLQLQWATLATYDLSLMRETLSLYRRSLDAGQITLTAYYAETSALYDRLAERARLEDALRQTLCRLRP